MAEGPGGGSDGADAGGRRLTVLVGGVGELFRGDLDLGRVAAERLAAEDLGPDAVVEDLHYGALAVTQLLEDLRPEALILVGAVARDRPPGTVERRRVSVAPPTPDELRWAVEAAGTGHVSIDLVVAVAAGLEALPGRTVSIEVEPTSVEPAEMLSEEARRGLEQALDLVRTEVRRIPLLEVADRVHALMEGDRLERTPAVEAMEALLAELRTLDRTGRWGRAFALRDRLRLAIAAGDAPDGMDTLDWTQWWGLVEELDRLQSVEARL